MFKKSDKKPLFEKCLVKLMLLNQSEGLVQQRQNPDSGAYVEFMTEKMPEFRQNNNLLVDKYSKFMKKQEMLRIKNDPNFIKILFTAENQFHLRFFNISEIMSLIKVQDQKVELPCFYCYEQYLLNVINMYAAMCKGRNLRSINAIRNTTGFQKETIKILLKQLKRD